MLVVFTPIIIMAIQKNFLKRKLEINQQYEVQQNSCGDHPKSVELDDQLLQDESILKTELLNPFDNFDDDISP